MYMGSSLFRIYESECFDQLIRLIMVQVFNLCNAYDEVLGVGAHKRHEGLHNVFSQNHDMS